MYQHKDCVFKKAVNLSKLCTDNLAVWKMKSKELRNYEENYFCVCHLNK